MRRITIRECAVDALKAMDDDRRAGALLLAICGEALGGEAPDFDALNDYGLRGLPSIYAAIAPDIIASVRDERDDDAAPDEMPSWTASVTCWGDCEPTENPADEGED